MTDTGKCEASGVVARAWAAVSDPGAMLAALHQLHPGRHPHLIARLAEQLARAVPSQTRMAEHAYVLSRRLAREEAPINATDPFRFVSLANVVRGELTRIESGMQVGAVTPVDATTAAARYADAIREVIPHPCALPAR